MSGEHRVVLASLGSGGFAHLPVLRRLRPTSDAELAELMLQAPSELALLADADAALEVGRMLDASGLDVHVQPAEHPFVAGRGEFDVAVHADDPARTTEVVRLVSDVLGVGATIARGLLCATPPALLGNVSAATVAALRERFAALGATLVASRRADARYDLVVGRCPPRVRERLRASGALGGESADMPLVLPDLRRGDAEASLAELARSAAEANVVDRAFERFEVRLDGCPATAEAERCLIELTGMPARVAARVPDNLPLVLLADAAPDVARAALVALDGIGASATAELITFRRHGVQVDTAPRPDEVRRVVAALTDDAPPVARLPHRLAPSLSLAHARWLVHELATIGAVARVTVA